MKTKIKGVSVQSIIVGSVITGVIAAAGLAALWPSVEKSKVYIIAETYDEQDAFITSQLEYDYSAIYKAHDAYDDGDDDYLDELITAGLVSNLPHNLFQKPELLTWEIRLMFDSDGRPAFYRFTDSTHPDDLELLTNSINHRGYL
jgi:hypothetical protein